MKLLAFTAFVFLAFEAQAEQTWYNFKTTWSTTPFDGFYDQPRTVDEAVQAGWVQVSNNCEDGSSFFGNRYAPPEDDKEMIIIFDVNGFIAGMHSVVPVKHTQPEFDFAASKWYRKDTVLGEEAYVTTAYFVDPSVICGSGRSQAEFDVEGTGNRLLFQNGPSSSDVITAPMTLEDADADGFWFQHYCFLNMGRHYFNLNYDPNQSCDELVPIQLVYSGGVLNAFVWQHPAAMPGWRWEVVNSFGLDQIVNSGPKCLYDLVENPGVRTMHTYVRNYGTLCIDDRSQ